MYLNNFDSWEDVQREYQMNDPEPEHVFMADYSYGSYDGDSLVAYYNNGVFYFVTGGHCSCCGLEGQWEPTEYESKELYLECLRKSWKRNDALIKLVEQFEVPTVSIVPVSRLEI